MNKSKMYKALEDPNFDKLLSKHSPKRKWVNLAKDICKELIKKPQNIKIGEDFVIIKLEQKRFNKYVFYLKDDCYGPSRPSTLIVYQYQPFKELDEVFDQITGFRTHGISVIMQTPKEEFWLHHTIDTNIDGVFNTKEIEMNPIEPLIDSIMSNLTGTTTKDRYEYAKQFAVKFDNHLF